MPKTHPFDQFSEAYDAWFEDHAALYEAELNAVRRFLPPGAFRGLEVGVGSGKFAAPLGIRTGVEPSEKMAAKARECGIEVFGGTGEDLPFPDACFDLVLMVTTLCFLDDPALAFREARRVLRPGGGIIVGFVDKESELGKKYLRESAQSRFYGEAVFYRADEVLTLLEDAGFRPSGMNQTLIPGKALKTICEGSGKGAFVTIKALK